jgi:hypothetical protein
VQRTAPTHQKNLVRKHFPEFSLISCISDNALTQLALTGTGLRGQDVTGKCVLAGDFACTRLLEALGRTLVCLQFRHGFL